MTTRLEPALLLAPAFAWAPPTVTTASTVGLAAALATEGPTIEVVVVGILFAIVAVAMTLLVLRHRTPASAEVSARAPLPRGPRSDRIDGAVAGLLNLIAVVALVVLWTSPTALLFVALALVPIAFACLLVISWPH